MFPSRQQLASLPFGRIPNRFICPKYMMDLRPFYIYKLCLEHSGQICDPSFTATSQRSKRIFVFYFLHANKESFAPGLNSAAHA